MTDNVVTLDSSIEDALSFDGLRVIAVLRSREAHQSITSYLTGFEGVEYDVLTDEEFIERSAKVQADPPEILILEVESEADAVVRINTLRAKPEFECLHICILMKSPTKSAIVNLLRQGADDILSITPNEIELSGSLARSASQRASSEEKQSSNKVRTIVFLHASGGAGATTLAVNSAVQLQRAAQKYGGNACLIDLDLQFGDADLQLDLPVRSSLIDLVKSPDRLDFRMFENLVMPGPEGMRVLTAPDQPLPLEAIQKQTVDNILSLARRHYRYVIVDMPITLTSWTDSVLRRADCIFVVTQVNVLALRAARRLIDTLQEEDIGGTPIVAIANRYPSKGPGRKISIAEAEKTLRVPIKMQVPNEFELLINSLDQGVPASVQNPASKYSKTVDELLSGVNAKAAGKKRRRRRKSFLRFGG